MIEQALKKITNLTLKEFIERAVEGEWKDYIKGYDLSFDGGLYMSFVKNGEAITELTIHEMFLDPKSWRAVGKVSNWNFNHRIGSHSDDRGGESDNPCNCLEKEWQKKMHQFIDALIEQDI